MEFIPYKANKCFEHLYYQIPMELFINPNYKDNLNSDSKILYSFLLDRLSLSQRNNWIDEENRIYLIFTRQEVQEKLNLSDNTVSKAFKQLNDVELIKEKKRGLGKPNLIYVGKIQHQELENLQFLNRKKYDSGYEENTTLETENLRAIKPNNINTNISKSILSNLDEVDGYANIFKKNIEYEVLISNPNNVDLIKDITNVAIDTLNSKKDFVYINSEPRPAEIVKSQLLKINPRTY